MLLARLKEYAEAHADALPPPYYVYKPIRWCLALTEDGRAAPGGLIDLGDGPKSKVKRIAVPDAYRSGPKPRPYLLCDTAEYVLGVARDESEKAEDQAQQRGDEFLALVGRWVMSAPGDPMAAAVGRFLDRDGFASVPIPDDLAARDWVAIMVGARWAHQQPSAQSLWRSVVQERKGGVGRRGLCLVCGQVGVLLGSIPESVKAGAIPSDGRVSKTQLVSVNTSAQARAGVMQLGCIPVCDGCGALAMSALNALLAEPKHRYRGRGSVLAWWTTEEPGEIDPWGDLDGPDPAKVKRLLELVDQPVRQRSARRLVDPGVFCALSLGANRARVVVRDWIDVPVAEVKENLGWWFRDCEIYDGWERTVRHLPLWRLTAAGGRWNNKKSCYVDGSFPENLDEGLRLAALRHTAPPGGLLMHLLQRMRADHRVDPPRAALLRLVLARTSAGGGAADINGTSRGTATMPGLDPDCTDIGYLCGRLFAVYENTQYAALSGSGRRSSTSQGGGSGREAGRGRGPNTTVADKFYGTAMVAPRQVLLSLDRGVRGHLKRLRRERAGTAVALEKELQAVWGLIQPPPAGGGVAGDSIPAVLPPRQQALFALGYYHQRQASFQSAAEAREAATS